MMMMWMMTRSPALFVLLSLSATTTSVTGLSVRRNSYTPWGPYHVDDWKEMITEDLDDTAMDSKEKSELLELAAKEYKGLADKASEAKVAITVDDKAPPAWASPFGLLGARPPAAAHNTTSALDGDLASAIPQDGSKGESGPFDGAQHHQNPFYFRPGSPHDGSAAPPSGSTVHELGAATSGPTSSREASPALASSSGYLGASAHMPPGLAHDIFMPGRNTNIPLGERTALIGPSAYWNSINQNQPQ